MKAKHDVVEIGEQAFEVMDTPKFVSFVSVSQLLGGHRADLAALDEEGNIWVRTSIALDKPNEQRIYWMLDTTQALLKVS